MIPLVRHRGLHFLVTVSRKAQIEKHAPALFRMVSTPPKADLKDKTKGTSGSITISKGVKKVAIVGASGAATVALAPMVLAAAGFASGGIAAGSLAAYVMSCASTTGYGMAVVAALQSAGATGIGLSTNILLAAGGGTCGNVFFKVSDQFLKKIRSKQRGSRRIYK